MNADDAAATVRRYYAALRSGEPLYPFFAEDDSLVKFGISERLTGYEAVAEGLREQTRTTQDWTVESRDLRVAERDRHAWFGDDVRMAWTDVEADARRDFETRWSGTLERREGDGEDDESEAGDAGGAWRFVGMHVSVAQDL